MKASNAVKAVVVAAVVGFAAIIVYKMTAKRV